MLTLETFERLSVAPVATKPVSLQAIGSKGELMPAWTARLTYLDKHEQYRHIKGVLSELVVADIKDDLRLTLLEGLIPVIERLVLAMQQEYINNPQSPPSEQRTYIDEVRSLYFLSVLCYQGVAFRTYQVLNVGSSTTTKGKKPANTKASWVDKLKGSVVRNGIGMDWVGGDKRLFVLSVYRVIHLCYKLLLEYALTYQKAPNCLWRLMNDWYLKSAILEADKVCVSKLANLGECSIYQQYLQSCLASFANLFSYRRPDILNGFKIIPVWTKHIKTTFTASSQLKLFVNLQGDTAPELITPYASINPYSNDYVCLFFEVKGLFDYLLAIESGKKEGVDGFAMFEKRLAKMVLMAFYRQSDDQSEGRTKNQAAEIVVGFGATFREMAGKPFNQVIAQSKLADIYLPHIQIDQQSPIKKELVKLVRKNEVSVQFALNTDSETETGDKVMSCPYLPIFGLFAMKSTQSTSKHPWRLGLVHWVDAKDDCIEVGGRFLGRVLSVCGIRLNSRDMRSKDFVQALLVSGDELNQQTTLMLPRYHFKEGDLVILRVEQKETSLRLQKNLLSTDEIEQYEIVRLT